MIGQQKNNRTLYYQNYDLIEKSVIFCKIQMHIRIILEFFEKHKCLVLFFLISRAPDMLLTNSRVQEQVDFIWFIFSAPISFSLCFPISPSLLFVLSLTFIKHNKAFVYIYINNMYIYIRKFMNFCLTKNL